MPINRCHNAGCLRPAGLFEADDPYICYCSEDCREEEHRRLRGGQRRSAQPQKPVTLSVAAGWTVLANESAEYDPYFGKMRSGQQR